MVVAGLRKASGTDSFLGENHSLASRRCVNNERLTTRTSSIRKMWRDLESEDRVGENGKQMSGVLTGPESSFSSSLESEYTSTDANENDCPPNQIELQNGQENEIRLCVHQSPSFDVPEKERARKIFHEWGSKSFGAHTLYTSRMSNCSRAQLLGENGCKRVRIVREWIESSTQQGDVCRGGPEEPATEIDSQIERVRDGTVDCGAGARNSIRRIFGRQALIDLLKNFERERKRELEGLLENRFVTNFGHRHRIQSLLKGRFLRNQRFEEDSKHTSVAANELGLLRKTNAVSDIRKGFLSKLNNNDPAAEGAPSDSDTISNNDMKNDHTEQPEEIVQEIPAEIGEEFETTNLACDWESHTPQECISQVGERHDAQSDSDTSSDNGMKYDLIEQAQEFVEKMANGIEEEFEPTNLASDLEDRNLHEVVSPDEREKVPLAGELTETVSQHRDDSLEINQSMYNIELSQGTSSSEFIANGPLPDVEELEIHEASVSLHPFLANTDSFNWQEVSLQAEEWQESVTEDEDDDGGWYQETVRSEFQESHEWYDDSVVEDPTEIWFGGTSYLEASLVGRSNAFYPSDGDNGSRVELSELTSRRRVSNLLQSDFGARLDQLMQSYVDRQDQAFESESGRMQDQEQHSLDENGGSIEAVESTEVAYPSPAFIPETHGNGNDGLQSSAVGQFPAFHQHLGTEREIINGLRIDLNTLQERMNDMQKMLEACMDVQLELQRSVQQEVYSALNRSINSRGACEDGTCNYQSGSSSGKEGVCSLCCDDDFEYLPIRSVHMYTCSKCARKINWSKLKESVRQP